MNGQLPPELIDASKLGMLKLEHELDEAYSVAPKVYWLKTTEGASGNCTSMWLPHALDSIGLGAISYSSSSIV